MKRTWIRLVMVGLSLAGVLTWSAAEAGADRDWQGLADPMLAQAGQKVTGNFKGMNTKGTKWTVTIRFMNQETSKTYPLAADIFLTYKGDFIPWQHGIIVDSIVELLLDGGEVKVINVVEWAS